MDRDIIISKKKSWIYIVPIYNLEISSDLDGEFTLGRVKFVSNKKIPHITKRLGISLCYKKILQADYEKDFFNSAKTFAFYSFSGNPKEEKIKCRLVVDNMISVLSISQLGYCTRRNNSQFGFNDVRIFSQNFCVQRDSETRVFNFTNEVKVLPFILNKEWRDFHKNFFFFKLCKILFPNDEKGKKLDNSWKETILRAAVIIGKSIQSRDLSSCFIWNMIVVEMLLTMQGDKYTDALPKRVEAFVGWVKGFEDTKNNEVINDLYKKRCAFVHDGNTAKIEIKDLLFLDDLVFNLFLNIANHINIFPNKKAIVSFSEKIQAEKLLGIKSKMIPKTFKFMKRHWDEDDFTVI